MPLSKFTPLNCLFLDLNSYFASCEQQENPHLVGKPVAVVPMMARTTCCIAASYEAKAFGIKTGTIVSDALKACPPLQLVEARPQLYVEYHHRILEAVESCTPIDSIHSIDELSCKLTGSQQELSKAMSLSTNIKDTIYKKVGTQLRCSIGLSLNRFLAKVASDIQKPDGLTLLTSEKLPEALYPLKLRDLPGIGPRMEKRMNQSGIFTIQALYQLNSKEMAKIWGGIGGERFYLWLRGEEPPVPVSEIAKSLGHQHVLPPALRDPKSSAQVLRSLLVKAAAKLRRKSLFAKGLMVHIKYLDRESWKVYRAFQSTQDTLVLMRTLNALLTSMPSSKPLRVGVVLCELVPESQAQLSLFQDENEMGLSSALDLIHQKYGNHSLYFGGAYYNKGAKIAFNHIPDKEDF